MDIWCWLKFWSPVWGPFFTAFIAGFGVWIAYRALRGQIKHSTESLDALRKQIELSGTSLRVNTTLELDKSFNSKEFKLLRRKAAQTIRNKDLESQDVDDVLDFFENLGLLLRLKIIDEEMTWHTFFWWFHRYWKLSQAYVEKKQRAYHMGRFTGYL